MRFKKIYIEITNRCNLRCSFCSKNNRELHDMSIYEFETVLKKIKPYTNYIYLHVKGEPLIHPHLKELLDLCTKYYINVNITTNGTNIDKVHDILLSSCVRQVNFSLHSYVLNNPDKYIEDIFRYVDDASELGKYIQFRFWAYNGKYSDNEKYFIDQISNKYDVDEDIISSNKSVKIGNNIFISLANEFIWPDINNDYYSECGTCYAIRDHIAILSNGDIVPCCLDSDGIIKLGSIYTNDIEDVLKSDIVVNMMEGFKNNKKTEELCRHCNFLDVI